MKSNSQANDIVVDSSNIQALVDYVAKAKELNAFVKQNFSKKTRENDSVMGVAPFIDDFHKEIAVLEKKIAEYKKRSHDCIVEGEYYLYLPEEYPRDRHNKRSYVHVLHKSPDGKRLTLEEVNITCYTPNNMWVEALLKEDKNHRTNVSSTPYIDAYYAGRLTKINRDEWTTKKLQVREEALGYLNFYDEIEEK